MTQAERRGRNRHPELSRSLTQSQTRVENVIAQAVLDRTFVKAVNKRETRKAALDQFCAYLRDLPNEERTEVTQKLIAFVGLEKIANRPVHPARRVAATQVLGIIDYRKTNIRKIIRTCTDTVADLQEPSLDQITLLLDIGERIAPYFPKPDSRSENANSSEDVTFSRTWRLKVSQFPEEMTTRKGTKINTRRYVNTRVDTIRGTMPRN